MNVVWSVALDPRGVLSSEAIKELPGWGTEFGTEAGNLLAGAAEQWP